MDMPLVPTSKVASNRRSISPTPNFHSNTVNTANGTQRLNQAQSIETTIDGPTKKKVSEDEMRQLIEAMQGNFNMVCDQLREAQSFYDSAEKCIQLKEEEQE